MREDALSEGTVLGVREMVQRLRVVRDGAVRGAGAHRRSLQGQHGSCCRLPLVVLGGRSLVSAYFQQQELGYKEEAISKYMCAGQVLGAVADVN